MKKIFSPPLLDPTTHNNMSGYSSSGGSGAVASLTQVQLVSNEDAWLTLNPECTFFQQEYCRHTPFAITETDITSSSVAKWGNQLVFEVPRAGDLLASTLLALFRKGARFAFSGVLPPGPVPDDKLLFVHDSAYAGIDHTVLEIGSIQVDCISGEFLDMLEQHRANVGNEQGSMIGAFSNDSDLRDWTFNDQVMYAALHFFFFEHPEMYLPLIALSAHAVRVKVWLRQKLSLLNAFGPSGPSGIDLSVPGVLDSVYNGELTDAALTTRLVFLDQFERNLVSAEVHEVVMLEHQEQTGDSVTSTDSQKSVTLSFNNAVLAMFMRWRGDSLTSQSNLDQKDYFEYTVQRPGVGIVLPPYDEAPPWLLGMANGQLRKSPIKTWSLKFNGQDRVAQRGTEYFTHVTPFLHAVKQSRSNATLSYYFHLAPLTDYHTPAGHAMFSRLHEVKSIFTFWTAGITFAPWTAGAPITLESGSVSHMCMSYNVYRISHGQFVKKFS